MFWQMPSIVSNIEPLLNKPDVQLSEILEDESVIQECKSQNQKLINYLAQDAILDQLVDAVVTEPSAELPHRQRYRLANVCCELLASDADALTSGLVKDDSRLNRLYAFLQAEPPLNPLLSSFFSKVMQLLARKQSERLLTYLSSKGSEFVDLIIRHMGTSAIMDFLVAIVTMRPGDEYGQQYQKQQQQQQQQQHQVGAWLASAGLVDKLLATLANDRSAEEQYNGAQCLISVIAYCRDLAAAAQETNSSSAANADASTTTASETDSIQAGNSPVSLLDQLECSHTAASVLAKMLDGQGGPSESSVAAGAQVLLALLDGRRTGAGGGDIGDFGTIASLALAQQQHQRQAAASETDRLAAAALNVIEAVAPRLRQLSALLSVPPPHRLARMPTTAGELAPPLGQCRLHVARLLRSILSTNSALAGRAVAESGALPALLSLMLDYPWNTFLHQAVEQACTSVLTAQPANQDQAEAQTQLLHQLLIEANLPGRLLEAFDRPTLNDAGDESAEGDADAKDGDSGNASVDKKPAYIRRLGYLGHLARLANCLNDALTAAASTGANGREHLAEAFNKVDEKLRQQWTTWSETYLVELNRRSVIVASPLSSQDDDAQPYSFDPSPLQLLHQAYADFQAKQLTSNFPDHFGFQEDEFNEPYDRVEAIFDDKVSNLDFTTPTPEDADNATMFDQACNSQIQQYDDEEEEDDNNDAANHDMDENGDGDLATSTAVKTANTAQNAAANVVIPRLLGGDDNDDDDDDVDDANLDTRRTPRTPPHSPSNRLEGNGSGEDVIDDEADDCEAVEVIGFEVNDDDDDEEEEEEGIGPAVILSGGARRKVEAAAASATDDAARVAADLSTAECNSGDAAQGGGEEAWPEFTNLEQLMMPAEDSASGDQAA